MNCDGKGINCNGKGIHCDGKGINCDGKDINCDGKDIYCDGIDRYCEGVNGICEYEGIDGYCEELTEIAKKSAGIRKEVGWRFTVYVTLRQGWKAIFQDGFHISLLKTVPQDDPLTGSDLVSLGNVTKTQKAK